MGRVIAWGAAGLLWVVLVGCGSDSSEQPRLNEVREARAPNVLFISVDDLRPSLGCYGDERAVTPRIDALAARGLLFERAYCQMAVCQPSRAAVLSGLRPETTGVMDLGSDYRERLPDLVALPQLFKNAGYTTLALGKVHHGGGELDDARSWSSPPWRPARWQRHYGMQSTRDELARLQAEAAASNDPIESRRVRFFAWEAPDVADDELGDGLIAAEAVRLLEKHRDEPLFLAVGFLKPHLPFVAPKRYWDLYPEGSMGRDPRVEPPVGAPDFALLNSLELRAYWNVPDEGPIDDATIENLVRGYYACTSFVDAQVGKLLDALERFELDDDTIVVLWGDHGWHLGDLGIWGKHTNYELATRSPLIVHVPGRGTPGSRSRALVELVDLYPTLAELCGLAAPTNLEATSFAPLLDDPARAWKRGAFHLYPRGVPGVGSVTGRAVRTDRFRLVEWTGDDSDFLVRELYDFEGAGETANVAGSPELAEEEAELVELLRGGWRAALPAPESGSR